MRPFGKLSDHGFGKKRQHHEPLMTASELAQLKGYSCVHMREKLKDSGLSCVTLGQTKYYKRSELLKWFDNQRWIKNT